MNRIMPFVRRNSVTIGVAIIAVAFGLILFMVALSNARLQAVVATQQQTLDEVKGITEAIATAANQRTEQINGIDRHLDCIVLFFTTEDRAARKITDIDTCQLENTETGNVLSRPQASVATPQPQTTPTPQSTPQPEAQEPETPASEAPQNRNFFERNIIDPVSDFLNGLRGVQ